MSIANLFSNTYASKIDTKGSFMLDLIEKSGKLLALMIYGLLQFSKIDSIILLTKTKINLKETLVELSALIGNNDNLKISL